MQAAEPYVEEPDKVEILVNSREQAEDDTTDREGEEVIAKEEAAEGQTAKSLQTRGNVQLPSEQEKMRRCERDIGRSATGQRASTRRRKMACVRRRHRPAPGETKNLKWTEGRSRL
jgi:hypothetical protein